MGHLPGQLARGCQAARVPFMATDLPVVFVPRARELDQLRCLLLDFGRSDPVAITTAHTGAGGFGKTTQTFDDGILSTTLGETPNLADAVAKLYAGLTGERPSFKDAEDAATFLAEKPQQKTCLIVIDDVWDPAYAWRWFGYHLREAGCQGELDALLGDLPWL